MCLTTKDSLLAFTIIILISIVLYIRNIKYDRILSYFFVMVSLIQLIEFGYHNGNLNGNIGGLLIFITLWLQIVVFNYAIYRYFKTKISYYISMFFIGVLIVALGYLLFNSISFDVRKSNGHLAWYRESQASILGNFGYLYLAGLLIPFLIVQYYSDWKDTGMWLLLGSVILSIIFVEYKYPDLVFPSLWCYSAVGISFVAWLIGSFHE